MTRLPRTATGGGQIISVPRSAPRSGVIVEDTCALVANVRPEWPTLPHRGVGRFPARGYGRGG